MRCRKTRRDRDVDIAESTSHFWSDVRHIGQAAENRRQQLGQTSFRCSTVRSIMPGRMAGPMRRASFLTSGTPGRSSDVERA